MIPADTAKPAHWLAVSSHSHAPTTVTSRFVVGMAARKTRGKQSAPKIYAEAWICVECKDGWCNARDTVNSAELKSAPVAEITRYFARNHVSFQQR
jgi:hypothetical protein